MYKINYICYIKSAYENVPMIPRACASLPNRAHASPVTVLALAEHDFIVHGNRAMHPVLRYRLFIWTIRNYRIPSEFPF